MLATTAMCYEAWFDEDTEGCLTAALVAVESTGQERLVGSHVFGPFASPSDACTWVWNQLRLDLEC